MCTAIAATASTQPKQQQQQQQPQQQNNSVHSLWLEKLQAAELQNSMAVPELRAYGITKHAETTLVEYARYGDPWTEHKLREHGREQRPDCNNGCGGMACFSGRRKEGSGWECQMCGHAPTDQILGRTHVTHGVQCCAICHMRRMFDQGEDWCPGDGCKIVLARDARSMLDRLRGARQQPPLALPPPVKPPPPDALQPPGAHAVNHRGVHMDLGRSIIVPPVAYQLMQPVPKPAPTYQPPDIQITNLASTSPCPASLNHAQPRINLPPQTPTSSSLLPGSSSQPGVIDPASLPLVAAAPGLPPPGSSEQPPAVAPGNPPYGKREAFLVAELLTLHKVNHQLRKQLHAQQQRLGELEDQLEEPVWQVVRQRIHAELSDLSVSAPPTSAFRVSDLQHLADIEPPMIRRLVKSLPSDLAAVKITPATFQ